MNEENKPSTEGLPFDPTESKETADSLTLVYRNETGSSVTRRIYNKKSDTIHSVIEEWMYSFVAEKWECTNRHERNYSLRDGTEILQGDGSGWDGTGKNWKVWFKHRHTSLLSLRYPNDNIPEPDTQFPDDTTQYSQAAPI